MRLLLLIVLLQPLRVLPARDLLLSLLLFELPQPRGVLNAHLQTVQSVVVPSRLDYRRAI